MRKHGARVRKRLEAPSDQEAGLTPQTWKQGREGERKEEGRY